MKKILLIIGTTVCLLVSTAYAENTKTRGIYFEIGLGVNKISYSEEVDDAIELLDGLGADRTTIFLDMGLGYAIGQKTYIVGSISGIGDRLSYDQDYLQLNTYLFGIGIRYYPFYKGLQLGADVGIGKMVMSSSDETIDNTTSDNGFGSKLTIAYDFDSTLTGPATLIGGALLIDTINNNTITSGSIYLNFIIK